MTRASNRANPAWLVLLGLAGLACVALFMRGCWPLHSFSGVQVWQWPWWRGPMWFGLWGLIQIGLAVWVGVDAHRRGLNGFLWGLLVFFTTVVGLIVYLLVGPSMAQPGIIRGQRSCPSCGRHLQSDFKLCPYCSASLSCHQCGRDLQPDWKLCPQCGTPIGGEAGSDGDPEGEPHSVR